MTVMLQILSESYTFITSDSVLQYKVVQMGKLNPSMVIFFVQSELATKDGGNT
jgi:hypothetical protein